MELRGRSALITGGSLGLGRAVAERYLREGASVFLIARGADALRKTEHALRPLVTQPGQSFHTMTGDVAKPEDCRAVVEAADVAFRGLTVLVNNAGVYGPIGPVDDVPWDAWVDALHVNVFGTVLMTRAVVPIMRRQGYGKIINVSGGGATAPLPRFSAYAASKAAVVRLTETIAHELRETHVDVNAMAPGPLNTRLLDEVLAAGPDRVGQDFYDRSLTQRQQGGAPLEKGAALAVFLASAQSDGITGRLLSALWDDWASLPRWRDVLAKGDIYTLRRIVPEDRGTAP